MDFCWIILHGILTRTKSRTKIAGVVKWHHSTFPTCRHGFDSRHPLIGEGIEVSSEGTPQKEAKASRGTAGSGSGNGVSTTRDTAVIVRVLS